MVDRPDQATGVLGYLHIEGVGGRSARDMRQLLEAFEDAYDAVARVELAAKRLAEGQEWLRRWGPPPRYWPGNTLFTGHIEVSGPDW